MRIALASLVLLVACASAAREPSAAPSPSASPSPSPSAAPSAAPSASASPTRSFTVTTEGELTLPSPITFVVRPLSGPGTMGPSELSPDSDAALQHVAAYIRAHPAADIRIVCAVNAIKMSSGPNAGRGAQLAHLVARWLVDRGISCKRLETAGVLERRAEAPVEHVRILVARGPGDAGEARGDPCAAR